ncbi:unnamed protein product [Rhizophagus irregularis]|uniref:Uncharacterized protein n=1 Tax=Rhizophagus irregularis TaxID=588596 RepID=A0A916ELL5_9GLOM|nr:unnamed protein product [Rhizophagus irregularis]CAB4424493.1 unnamed protein product [Rhizophagus irregularis]CAB4483015.1 unnamed protein product [Rhizophagus irregularis]CAB5177678.1 unnamed protein product [Rhizophagus irregularis]CAB5385070.1 unnamed protein product [Rhizophagus irregularis]
MTSKTASSFYSITHQSKNSDVCTRKAKSPKLNEKPWEKMILLSPFIQIKKEDSIIIYYKPKYIFTLFRE